MKRTCGIHRTKFPALLTYDISGGFNDTNFFSLNLVIQYYPFWNCLANWVYSFTFGHVLSFSLDNKLETLKLFSYNITLEFPLWSVLLLIYSHVILNLLK